MKKKNMLFVAAAAAMLVLMVGSAGLWIQNCCDFQTETTELLFFE
jgi:uncharacterized membrane protein